MNAQKIGVAWRNLNSPSIRLGNFSAFQIYRSEHTEIILEQKIRCAGLYSEVEANRSHPRMIATTPELLSRKRDLHIGRRLAGCQFRRIKPIAGLQQTELPRSWIFRKHGAAQLMPLHQPKQDPFGIPSFPAKKRHLIRLQKTRKIKEFFW